MKKKREHPKLARVPRHTCAAAIIIIAIALVLKRSLEKTGRVREGARFSIQRAPACHPPPQLPALAKLGVDTSTLCTCIPASHQPLRRTSSQNYRVASSAPSASVPSVSAIIPFYQQTEFLIECVKSLIDQTWHVHEIIIVNDGSPRSESLDIAFRDAMLLDARVKVLHQVNMGLPSARNLGIQSSTGDLVFFIDPDDKAHPRSIELLEEAIYAYDVDFAWGDMLFYGNLDLIWHTQDFNAYDLLWSNHPASQALVRRKSLSRYGVYESSLRHGMEDWAFWSRIAAHGATGTRVPLPIFHYRRHKLAMTSSVNANKEEITRQVIQSNAFIYKPDLVRNLKLKHRLILSVIMAFCDTKPIWADEALASLSVQTMKDFEVVIVNDGSRDRSALKWLKRQRRDNSWGFPLRIVDQDKSGPAAARNTGVYAARGDMIAFLDPDDRLTSTSLEKLALKLLLSNRTVAYAYGAVRHFGAINGTSRDAFDARRLLSENFLALFAVLWKGAYINVGGMDASFDGHEDYDLWLRMLQFGFQGAYVDEVYLEYRRHYEGRTGHFRRRSTFEEEHKKLRGRNPLLYGKPCLPQDHYRPMHTGSGLAQSTRQSGFQHKISKLRLDLQSPVKEESYRRPQHLLPFLPERYNNNAKPSILYVVPFMTFGGSEVIDLSILRGLRASYHMIVVVESAEKYEWEARFDELADEKFVLSRLASSQTRYATILDYLIVSRNVCLIFNRNSRHAYEMSPIWRSSYPELRQVDLIHLYEESYGAWERFSAPFHANYHARYVISDDLLHYMHAKYNMSISDFTVIRNGIDMRGYRNLAENQSWIAESDVNATRGLVLGFIGRHDDQKQPLKFVQVAKAVRQSVGSAHFIMIGQGPLRAEVENESSRHHLGIEFLNSVSPETIARMSILLSTSTFEGVPLVILEAGAVGVMTVAPNIGAVREAVGPLNGLMYAVNDSVDIIVDHVLTSWKSESPQRRRERREAAFLGFDETRMQQEYLESLSGLVASRNGTKAHEDFVYRLIDRPFIV